MRFHKVPMLLGLRVEYAKSHARARRWIEEVTLVKEEMRRVLSYFNWKMDWWLQKATSYRSINDEKSLAFIAYANYQVSLLKDVGKHFRSTWAEECGLDDFLPVISEKPAITFGLTVEQPMFIWDIL